jgi:hypothetical protein
MSEVGTRMFSKKKKNYTFLVVNFSDRLLETCSLSYIYMGLHTSVFHVQRKLVKVPAAYEFLRIFPVVSGAVLAKFPRGDNSYRQSVEPILQLQELR